MKLYYSTYIMKASTMVLSAAQAPPGAAETLIFCCPQSDRSGPTVGPKAWLEPARMRCGIRVWRSEADKEQAADRESPQPRAGRPAWGLGFESVAAPSRLSL